MYVALSSVSAASNVHITFHGTSIMKKSRCHLYVLRYVGSDCRWCPAAPGGRLTTPPKQAFRHGRCGNLIITVSRDALYRVEYSAFCDEHPRPANKQRGASVDVETCSLRRRPAVGYHPLVHAPMRRDADATASGHAHTT